MEIKVTGAMIDAALDVWLGDKDWRKVFKPVSLEEIRNEMRATIAAALAAQEPTP